MAKLFYYDLETTGTLYWKHGIHQISGCIEIDGEVKENFNFKVKPHEKAIYDEEALKVCGISREQIESYDSMSDVYNKLITMLSKYCNKYDKQDKMYLVGYNNTSFDNAFFKAFFVQNGDKYFNSWFWINTLDTLVLATMKLIDERSSMKDFKLSTIAEKMGILVDESKLHDAEYDIYLTREVFKKVCTI